MQRALGKKRAPETISEGNGWRGRLRRRGWSGTWRLWADGGRLRLRRDGFGCGRRAEAELDLQLFLFGQERRLGLRLGLRRGKAVVLTQMRDSLQQEIRLAKTICVGSGIDRTRASFQLFEQVVHLEAGRISDG